MRTISYTDFFKGGDSGSLRYVAIARLLPYTDCNSDHDDYDRQDDIEAKCMTYFFIMTMGRSGTDDLISVN